MRFRQIFVPLAVALVGALLAFRPAATEFGKITLPLGIVEVQSAGGTDWARAKVRHPVFAGDKVRTKSKSRAEITLNGGGKVRIAENSELELTEASVTPMKKNFNANLKKGKVWVAAQAAFGEKKNIAVRTPTAVAAIRGTKYRANAGDKESQVLVYEGKVDINTPENLAKMRRDDLQQRQQQGGPPKFSLAPVQTIQAPTQVAGPFEVTLEEWITLVEGMQINLRADGKYHMFEFDKEADAQNPWVQWNSEQDSQK